MILAIDPGNIESAYVEEANYKVYKHTVPNGKVYIGITSLTTYDRWRNGKGYKNSILFNRAIKKYAWENIKHDVLHENLTKEEAQAIEIRLIKQTRSNEKQFGYNIEHGGKTGANGIKRRPETIEKMRAANLGKVMPVEVKQKISKTLQGRAFSKEHRIKISLAQVGRKNHMYGKTISNEVRKKMSENQPKGKDHKLSRPVVQIDKNTSEVIKVWDSMGDVRRALGIKHCTISDCCRGKQKTSGGFKWRYYDD